MPARPTCRSTSFACRISAVSFIGPRRALLTSPTPHFLLDGRSDVAASYSMRLLRRGYRGPLVRFRRSSDNAEADFFADRMGRLQLNSALGWANGSSLFITKWYDQSGNGRDLAQTTASAQPAFGVLANGLPGMTFDGVDDYMRATFTLNQAWSFNICYRLVTNRGATQQNIFDGVTAGAGMLIRLPGTGDNVMAAPSVGPASDLGTSMATAVRGVVGGCFNAASSLLEVNATTIASFTGNVGANNPGGLTLGTQGDLNTNRNSNMEAQEWIVLNDAQTSAQVKALNASIRAAWRF